MHHTLSEKLEFDRAELTICTEKTPISTEEVNIITEEVTITKEQVPITTEEVTITKADVTITKEEVSITTDEVTITKADVTVTKEEVPITTDEVTITKADVTVTKEEVPITTDEVTITKADVTVTTEEVPITTDEVTITKADVTVTTEEVPITTEEVTITKADVTITKAEVPITTDEVTITKADVTVTTEEVPITTDEVTITKADVTVTTEEVPITTEEVTITKAELPVTADALRVDEPREDIVEQESTKKIEAEILPIPAQAPMSCYRILDNDVENEQENTTNQQSDNSSNAMEKFRKRLIHTVAQHLRDNKPLDELWPNMKALTFDCKQLWTRMRALTLKKISRLLPAEDRTDRIPKVARMTFTDWLMFDLVLVHEDIDLISWNDKYDEQSIPKVLKELFVLVQRFDLEESSHSVDPAGWAAATLFYNHNGRRLISPMLLQKRWYQMKRSTRLKFVHFWQVYKGHQTMLEKARVFAPNLLQQAIAKRYNTIITQDFLSWKDLIDQKKIVMPECFTNAIRSFPEPCDLEDPDLILLEPEIETINLDQDSECDENENDGPDISKLAGISKGVIDRPDSDNIDPIVHQDNSIDPNLIRTEEDLGIKSEPVEFEMPLTDEAVNPLSDILEQQKLIEAEEEEENCFDDQILDVEDEHCDDSDLLSRPNDGTVDDSEVFDVAETADRSSRQEWDVDINVKTVGQLTDNLIHEIEEKSVMLETTEIFPHPILTDNMEFVDDGIELIEEHGQNDEAKETKSVVTEIVKSSILDPDYDANNGPDENPYVTSRKQELGDNVSKYSDDEESTLQAKFDLKLLMIPVVYTTKLEHMSVFKNYDVIDTVHVANIIDDVISESVPVSAKAVNVKTEIRKFDANEVDSFHSDVEKDTPRDLISLSLSNYERNGDTKIKVRANSRLFQKPRTREYSTVQLCKNPDFNTKLKRLSAGFYIIARNRQFLKLCKPVTIDLHKSFEFHLNNGSLILDDADQLQDNKRHQDVQFNPIMPSAMPIQSLVDKEKVDINDLLTNSVSDRCEERIKQDTCNHSILHKKYEYEKIDPKDIIRIKRLNNHVLTAEISPLEAKSKTAVKCVDESPHQMIYDKHSSVNSKIQYYPDTALTNTNPLNTTKSRINMKTTGTEETQEQADSFSKVQRRTYRKYTRKGSNESGPRRAVQNTKPKKYLKDIAVPWSSCFYKSVVSDFDFNLASDTLNKMLQALGDTNFVYKNGKFIEKNGNVTPKKRYPGVRKRNVNVTEEGKREKNRNITKKRNCCWYSRFHGKVKGPDVKRKGHKCGEVCTCCCKHLQWSEKSEEWSDRQDKGLNVYREAEKAVENLQESIVSDNDCPVGRDADKSTTACIVLSDDDVEDIPKKPKIRIFSKSKSPFKIQIKSNKEFINLNEILAKEEAKKKRVNSKNDNILLSKNLPDLIPSSNVSVSPLQTEDKIRVISDGPNVDFDPRSLVEPKNFALSVDYDGKLMQLQLIPGNENKDVENVKNILSLSKKSDIEPNNADDSPAMQVCDYSISSPVLPNGVHLVLLPNQQVMPYVEHGCNLSENELKDIQYIISYVQYQLCGRKSCEIKYPLHNSSIINAENSTLRELNVATALDKVNTIDLSAKPSFCTASIENNDNDTLARNKHSEVNISYSITIDSDDSQASHFQKDISKDHSIEKNEDIVDQSTSDKNMQTLAIDAVVNKSGTDKNSDVDASTVGAASILDTSCEHAEDLEDTITNHELLQPKTNSNKLSEREQENGEKLLGKIKIKQFASLSESFSEVTDIPERHNIGKTSILSDLMEMSGISSEDVLVSPEKYISTPRQSVFKNPESLQIPQSANRNDTELSSMLKSNDGSRIVQTVPIRILTSVTVDDSSKQESNVGSTAGIPVAKRQIIYKLQKPLAPSHSVINVDSDDGIKILPTVNRTSKSQVKKYVRSKKSVKNNFIGMIIEKKTPSILRHSRNNSIRSKIIYEEQSQKKVNVQNKLPNKRKRKECLKQKAKIEAKIDLLDSDEPMEEEYLVDSFDSDSDMSQKDMRSKHKQKTGTGKRKVDLYDSSSNECMSTNTNLDLSESSLVEKYLYTTGDSAADESNDSSLFTTCKPNKQKIEIEADCDSSSITKPKSKITKRKMEICVIDSTSPRKQTNKQNGKRKKRKDNNIASFVMIKDCSEKRKTEAEKDISQLITFKKRKGKKKIEIAVGSSPLSTLKLDTENESYIIDTDSSDDEPLAKKILRNEVPQIDDSKTKIDDDINVEQGVNNVKESADNCNNSEDLL